MEIYAFQRNSVEQVKARLTEFKGKQYADLRIFWMGDDGQYRPSKKGLTVSPDQLPELAQAVAKLQNAISGKHAQG